MFPRPIQQIFRPMLPILPSFSVPSCDLYVNCVKTLKMRRNLNHKAGCLTSGEGLFLMSVPHDLETCLSSAFKHFYL